jgi:polar amino acid transport system permease protein
VLASFDTHLFWEALTSEPYWRGALLAIALTCAALAAAVLLGFPLALGRASRFRAVRIVVFVYSWFFRATPTLLLLLIVWDVLPQLWPVFTHSWYTAFLAAFIALALNEAAYMAEIIRAGITSVPEGQSEASTALGMSWGMTMRRTVLPQAMRVIIPPTGNEVISMLKTTSLVTAVPYSYDLYSIASREIAARTFEPVPLLMVAATWYLVVTSVLMVGQYYLEKYFSRGISRKLTTKQLEALAKAQTTTEAGHV